MTIDISTTKKHEIVNITSHVADLVDEDPNVGAVGVVAHRGDVDPDGQVDVFKNAHLVQLPHLQEPGEAQEKTPKGFLQLRRVGHVMDVTVKEVADGGEVSVGESERF